MHTGKLELPKPITQSNPEVPMSIFISHASADKSLVDAFVDMLQTGLSLTTDDFFALL
jgi:chloramphenicol O-acetyltransferase